MDKILASYILLGPLQRLQMHFSGCMLASILIALLPRQLHDAILMNDDLTKTNPGQMHLRA